MARRHGRRSHKFLMSKKHWTWAAVAGAAVVGVVVITTVAPKFLRPIGGGGRPPMMHHGPPPMHHPMMMHGGGMPPHARAHLANITHDGARNTLHVGGARFPITQPAGSGGNYSFPHGRIGHPGGFGVSGGYLAVSS